MNLTYMKSLLYCISRLWNKSMKSYEGNKNR